MKSTDTEPQRASNFEVPTDSAASVVSMETDANFLRPTFSYSANPIQWIESTQMIYTCSATCSSSNGRLDRRANW